MTKNEQAILDKSLSLAKEFPGASPMDIAQKLLDWAEAEIEDPEDPPDDEMQTCDTHCAGCSERKYDNEDCSHFVCDMEEVGLEVEHYHGRFFWEGPAVRVDNIQDALSHTKVPCQYDNMGLGYIVYPKQSGQKVEE